MIGNITNRTKYTTRAEWIWKIKTTYSCSDWGSKDDHKENYHTKNCMTYMIHCWFYLFFISSGSDEKESSPNTISYSYYSASYNDKRYPIAEYIFDGKLIKWIHVKFVPFDSIKKVSKVKYFSRKKEKMPTIRLACPQEYGDLLAFHSWSQRHEELFELHQLSCRLFQ